MEGSSRLKNELRNALIKMQDQSATIAAQAAEIERLEDQLAQWKHATGLARGGDPDGVRPDDLERELEGLRAAARDFVDKCERGAALSKDSYAKFQAALAAREEGGGETDVWDHAGESSPDEIAASMRREFFCDHGIPVDDCVNGCAAREDGGD